MATFKEILSKMTHEEKMHLASRMYNPIRCGGAGWEDGKYYLILGGKKCFAKEINDVIRKMNPKWSDEELRSNFHDEEKQDGSHLCWRENATINHEEPVPCGSNTKEP
jgi:hypothetical protein